MSHYLSRATQQRLEVRKIDTSATNELTLQCFSPCIPGQFRCVTAVSCRSFSERDGGIVSPARQRDGQILGSFDDTTTVWTGEADGSVSIRHMTTGLVLATVPRKINRADSTSHIFVFSLCSPRRDQVWAGMSDGSVQVFHAQTREILLDFRAHSSSVTAMIAVPMPTNDEEFEHHMNVVVTASSDWTIAKWDTTTFHCLGKLNGHRLSVKCLAASTSGEFLLSGGEDGVLHMWSLMLNEEVVGGADPTSAGPTYPDESMQQQQQDAPVWPVIAHDAAVSSVLFVRDAYIVSAGLDGVACVWSLQGMCLHILERRNSGLTSLLFDSVGSRIWVGGIDGVLRLYNDSIEFGGEYAWCELGCALDHSGAYISASQVVREDHLQRVWLVDESGMATFFIETLNRNLNEDEDQALEGDIPDSEFDAAETIDECRQEIVQSYSELRQHRIRLAKAEATQRARREALVRKFGNCAREKQYAIFKMQRWVLRQKELALAKHRCAWFSRCSERSFATGCFWKWLLWARESAGTRLKTKVTDIMRSLTTNMWKESAARQLKHSVQEEKRRSRMLAIVTMLSERGCRRLQHRFFVRWFIQMLQQRKSACRSHVAGSRIRLNEVTLQCIRNRDESKAKQHQNQQEHLKILSDGLCALTSQQFMFRAFRRWADIRSARAVQRRTILVLETKSALDVEVQSLYFNRWRRFQMLHKCETERHKSEDLQAELRMWEELIREASSINRDTLQAQLQEEQEKSFRRAARLDALKQQAEGILDDIHDIKSDLVVEGLRLDAGLDIPSRVDAIFTYMKARGISAKHDAAIIKTSRDEYATLPLYVAPPPVPVATAAKTTTSPKRIVGGAAPARKVSTSPAVRRGSAPAAASSSPLRKKEPPLPRHLIGEFELLYKKLKQQVRVSVANAASEAGGGASLHSDPLASSCFLLGLTEKQDALLLDDEDWGAAPDAIQKLRRKDIKECAVYLRKMIVLYDCIKHKQQEAAALLQMYRTPQVQATPPMIPTHVLRQILCNAPSMLKLATHDFCLSAMEYVTIHHSDETENTAEPSSSSSPPKPRESPRGVLAPAAATATPPRRHSSPAASLRPQSPSASSLLKGKPLLRSAQPLPKPAAQPTPAAAPAEATQGPTSAVSAAEPEEQKQEQQQSQPQPSQRPPLSSSPAPPPKPKRATHDSSPSKPFIGLRLAIGPPIVEGMRTPSLIVAECNEFYDKTDKTIDGDAKLVGPAFAAGLRVGDILQRFAGYVVTDLQAFNTIVSRHARPGAVIPVQALSGGSRESKSLTIVVGMK